MTPKVQQWLIQQVTKESRMTSKELQASLASIKVSHHDSTKRKNVGKNGIHGSVPSKKKRRKENGLSHHYSWCKITLHLTKRTYSPMKQGSGRVLIWSFSTRMTCYDEGNNEFYCLAKKSWVIDQPSRSSAQGFSITTSWNILAGPPVTG